MATVVYGDFEWDDRKAAENVRRHGVTFEEASSVFDDPRALDAPDTEDSSRFVLIGWSVRSRVLFVVNGMRGDRVRIVSARKASPSQRRAYEEDT
jgi:uncharacterized protein